MSYQYRSRAAYLQGMRANIWKSYLFTGLRAMMIVMPIIALFYLDLGLSMRQLFLAQALFSLVLVAFEIPSGYVSDVLGRKRTLVIGAWIAFFGFLAYALATGFLEILLAEALIAIGASFISGTDTAILYDSLLELREEQTYKKTEGRRQSLARLLEGASAIAGGALAVISLRTPFIVQAGLLLLLVIVAYTFTDPETKKYRATKGHVRGMVSIVHDAFRLDPRLRWLILYSASVAASTLTAVWLLQPYFQAAGLPVGLFGIVWAAMYLVAAVASYFAHEVDELLGPRLMLLSLLFLPFIASMALALKVSLWMLLLIPAYQVVRAFQSVVIEEYLNKQLTSEKRATILSSRNFLYRLLFAALSPFIGTMADAYSIQTAFLWSGLLFAALSALAFAFLAWANHQHG